ncbi:DUF6884 domain-containing protein [Vibrio fluvialis]|uniref:DUF6884 domain-containing protein n=1 Tax=Vibrio fluvialis TaxID=676 RepID=UPI0033060182|nr:hypothetical protein KKIDH5335_48680 [Vibrio fluvialis]
MKTKPTLVIACSAAKVESESRCQAFDLYTGNVFKTIKANVPDALDRFNILILSAEHGLIPADKHIHTYDTKMCSRKNHTHPRKQKFAHKR